MSGIGVKWDMKAQERKAAGMEYNLYIHMFKLFTAFLLHGPYVFEKVVVRSTSAVEVLIGMDFMCRR